MSKVEYVNNHFNNFLNQLCFVISWDFEMLSLWSLAIRVLSCEASLLWHRPQVGPVIGWSLPQVLTQ